MKHEYWIKGSVNIPEEQKEEFNKNVLTLLRLCGIRKLKEIELAGRIVTVVCEPKADAHGIVRFDYSIFEGQKRQVSMYHMDTCELSVIDRGYGEFGLVMNLVMTMQEAYSIEECYLMRKNEVCNVCDYALLIQRIIGVKLFFSGPERRYRKEEHFICQEPHKNQQLRKEPLFYQVILRKNEDEFLEFWDDCELYLSDVMKKNLEEWKLEFEGIEEAEAAAVDTELCLMEILLEMQKIWKCRLVDEKLVREFIGHSKELPFQKGLLVWRKIMDENIEYFPELTARQVREWVTKPCCREEDRIRISGYASLLTNLMRRARLFGF